jgi:peroxiredoxin (alkyl hydroperoxide reductase subunit C)
VQIFGISCDNVDSLHPWAGALGTLSFPLLADFWPHGQVSGAYGVLNEWGVPDRVPVLVNGGGRICYVDTSHVHEVPPVDPILQACKAAVATG